MPANPMIESIRKSLGRAPEAPTPTRPPVLPARPAGSREAEITLLLEEIHKLSGNARLLPPADLPATLQDLVHRENIRRAALWHTPRLEALGVAESLRRLGVEIAAPNADKHLLATCDLGVTETDFALPETGTLGLLSSSEKPRAVSLLPRVHLALVSAQALRADLRQVFDEAAKHPYLIFITGPSRTADIELTVTLGVHGPKALYTWILEE